MRYLLIIYLKIRNLLKKFLFFIFSENSRIINLFVTIDIFIRKSGFLNQFIRGKFKYDELVFYHDPSDTSVASSILTNGTYEPELLSEIRKTLKSGAVFIEGGANIGFFSLIAAKIIGPTGVVIAFEPTPTTYGYLKKNIKINNISNVIISNSGLSSSEKSQSFLLSPHPEENSIIDCSSKSLKSGTKIINIKTVTIDKFCQNNNLKKVDLIKLDIEGQELEAIKGAKEILLKNKNIKIIFELNIAYQENGIEFANQIFTELKRLNFSNFQALLEPRIFIKDLNNLEDVELLKKITRRHNVNILATR